MAEPATPAGDVHGADYGALHAARGLLERRLDGHRMTRRDARWTCHWARWKVWDGAPKLCRPWLHEVPALAEFGRRRWQEQASIQLSTRWKNWPVLSWKKMPRGPVVAWSIISTFVAANHTKNNIYFSGISSVWVWFACNRFCELESHGSLRNWLDLEAY